MKEMTSSIYSDVYCFASLYRAFRRVRRARRGVGGEPLFYLDLEANLLGPQCMSP